MAVGSTGMLSTSNYAARKFGVRAAMPGFIGKKLCPELIIVPPNFDKYKAVSKVVREVFSEYDPGFSPMSLDEAYLDITEYLQKNSSLYLEEEDGERNTLVLYITFEFLPIHLRIRMIMDSWLFILLFIIILLIFFY